MSGFILRWQDLIIQKRGNYTKGQTASIKEYKNFVYVQDSRASHPSEDNDLAPCGNFLLFFMNAECFVSSVLILYSFLLFGTGKQ